MFSVFLHVEAEVDHIAVFNDVLLALAAEQPLLLRGGNAAAADHICLLYTSDAADEL